jgi:hypothetical protein
MQETLLGISVLAAPLSWRDTPFLCPRCSGSILLHMREVPVFNDMKMLQPIQRYSAGTY